MMSPKCARDALCISCQPRQLPDGNQQVEQLAKAPSIRVYHIRQSLGLWLGELEVVLDCITASFSQWEGVKSSAMLYTTFAV